MSCGRACSGRVASGLSQATRAPLGSMISTPRLCVPSQMRPSAVGRIQLTSLDSETSLQCRFGQVGAPYMVSTARWLGS